MARTPPKGPHVINGMLAQSVIDWILDADRTSETNIGSLVSGVASAQATATAAQATATAASQTAQATQSNAFSVTVDSPYAVNISSSPGALTTSQVTVTPSGGVAPYTYAWTKVSGDDLTINAPTAATTDFTGTPATNENLSGEYKCTVTDAALATASIVVGATVGNILITG